MLGEVSRRGKEVVWSLLVGGVWTKGFSLGVIEKRGECLSVCERSCEI